MVWFRVDDTLPTHHRVLAAGNAAMGLWLRCGAWSMGQLTDGFIPEGAARMFGSQEEIDTLVRVGLWHTVEGGYRFHAWAEDGTGNKRQPTRAEVEEQRRTERERKAAWRESHRSAGGRFTGQNEGVPEGVPVGQTAGRTPDGTADVRPDSARTSDRPDPTRPDPTRPIREQEEISYEISSETNADASVPDPRSTALALVPEEQKSTRRSNYEPTFEAFWAVYPRHEGKRAAATAFNRACRRASPVKIIRAATRYRDDPNRDDAYTAHATTWLNRDGWDDAPLPKRRPETQYERLQANAEATHEALARMGIA